MGYSEQKDFEWKDAFFFNMRRDFSRFNVAVDIESAQVLEIGGSGGLLGGLISRGAARTIVADTVDTQAQYGGGFPRLLREKFERNGRSLDLGKIEFHTVNFVDLPYRDGLFDIVVSNNVFQKIRDPFAALYEVIRILKPGGVAYLTVDPVWTADSGSHYSYYVSEPWAHLFCSTDEFALKMREAGAADWEISNFVDGLNRIEYRDYEEGFNRILAASGLKSFQVEHWTTSIDKAGVHADKLAKAEKTLNFKTSDLLVRGFLVLAIK